MRCGGFLLWVDLDLWALMMTLALIGGAMGYSFYRTRASLTAP
jgi:hypothetical protein